jgi:hypothetical protein
MLAVLFFFLVFGSLTFQFLIFGFVFAGMRRFTSTSIVRFVCAAVILEFTDTVMGFG